MKGKYYSKKDRGLIGYILVVIIAVVILGYFGFDLRRIIESPQVQENLVYAWNIIKIPFIFIWEFIKGLWSALVDFAQGFGSNFEKFNPETRIENFEMEVGE